jgi:hypothetical protein
MMIRPRFMTRVFSDRAVLLPREARYEYALTLDGGVLATVIAPVDRASTVEFPDGRAWTLSAVGPWSFNADRSDGRPVFQYRGRSLLPGGRLQLESGPVYVIRPHMLSRVKLTVSSQRKRCASAYARRSTLDDSPDAEVVVDFDRFSDPMYGNDDTIVAFSALLGLFWFRREVLIAAAGTG